MISRVFVILAILGLSAAQSANSTCFFPDGNVAKSYSACSATGDGGCCLESDFCTGLGYCVSNSKGYHYRGACTDSTWFNPSCPNYCLEDTNSGNTTAVNVIACNAAENGGTWCCAYDGNCCSSSATYTPYFGTIFAEPGAATATAASLSLCSSSSSATTTSETSSITSSSSSASQAAAETTPTASNSPQVTSTPVPASGSDNKTASIVGAAVGVPLGLAALAGFLFFFRERRKKNQIGGQYTKREEMNPNAQELSPDAMSYRHELPSNRGYE